MIGHFSCFFFFLASHSQGSGGVSQGSGGASNNGLPIINTVFGSYRYVIPSNVNGESDDDSDDNVAEKVYHNL